MKPSIIIPIDIRNKIQFIVDNCDKEVSGLGTVVFDPNENGYRVTDVMLLEQEVGSAHTDLDDQAVAKACFEMKDAEGELAFWWHSHVNMSVFWSSTDHDTMEKIGRNGLCVAVVFNKKEEMRGAIVMSPEGFPCCKHDDVAITVEHQYNFDTEALLKEIKDKVKEKRYTPTVLAGYTNGVDKAYTPKEQEILDNENKALKSMANTEWARMTKEERAEYFDFKDFYNEFIWGEHYGKTSNWYNEGAM